MSAKEAILPLRNMKETTLDLKLLKIARHAESKKAGSVGFSIHMGGNLDEDPQRMNSLNGRAGSACD